MVRPETSDREGRPRWRWLLVVNLVAVLVVAVWFRVRDNDRFPGVNGDETYIPLQVARFLETRDLHSERVNLRTFSGRPLDAVTVAYFLPALSLFKPTYGLIRSYPLAAGLLTLLLAYNLVARAWGRRTGLIAVFAFATAPVCIAASRMSWEPSLIPLFGVLTLALAARGRWVAVLAALPFGYLMHPTNLLLLPLLAFLIVNARFLVGEGRGLDRADLSRLAVPTLLTVAATAVLGALILWAFRLPLPYAAWRSSAAWGSYAVWFGRLFSGVTAFRYFVGTPHAAMAVVHDVVFWTVTVALLVAGLPVLVRRRQWDRVGVVAWAFGQPWILFLVAGPYVLWPPHSRFGMVFVAPALLGFAFLIEAKLENVDALAFARQRRWLTAALVGLLWVWLGDFQLHYFSPLKRTGGESYATYRTAAVEPKRQVLKLIRRDLAARRLPSAQILVDNFFLHYALEYLALPYPGLNWAMLAPFGVEKPEAQDRAIARLEAGAYLVSWSGASIETRLRRSMAEDRLRFWTVYDGAGRPLIRVVRLADPGEPPVAAADMSPRR